MEQRQAAPQDFGGTVDLQTYMNQESADETVDLKTYQQSEGTTLLTQQISVSQGTVPWGVSMLCCICRTEV